MQRDFDLAREMARVLLPIAVLLAYAIGAAQLTSNPIPVKPASKNAEKVESRPGGGASWVRAQRCVSASGFRAS